MSDQPQGKSMRELRAIIERDHARYSELPVLWGEMTEVEQDKLLAYARELAREAAIADAFTPPDPFSRKV